MRLSILIASLMAATTALAGERTLVDDTGRSLRIPEHPARIVVLHEPLLGLPLMELGANVVGSYGRKDDGSFVTAVDFIDTVLGAGHTRPQGIGPVGQIDLEKLRALQPDLIVGMELDLEKAPQLSTVAPVYLQNVSTGKTRGFGVEEQLAKVVGREDALATRKQAYQTRLEEVRKAIPENPAGKTYLAVFLTDQLNALGEMSGAIQALEDLGYARLPLGDAKSPSGKDGSMLLVPLGAEAFGRLNPDILVLMNSYMTPERDEAGTRAALERIVPGWEKFLKPAREGRVIYLDSAQVAMPTIASAEHTLDAMEVWAKR